MITQYNCYEHWKYFSFFSNIRATITINRKQNIHLVPSIFFLRQNNISHIHTSIEIKIQNEIIDLRSELKDKKNKIFLYRIRCTLLLIFNNKVSFDTMKTFYRWIFFTLRPMVEHFFFLHETQMTLLIQYFIRYFD